jgi:hypothetical protein
MLGSRGPSYTKRRAKQIHGRSSTQFPLSSLKKGEGYQLALDSNEALTLRRELHELARLQHEQGIPQGHAEFVRVESNLAALLELTQSDLHDFLSANKTDAFKVFSRVIRWLSEAPEIASQLALDETEFTHPQRDSLKGQPSRHTESMG